MQAMIKVCTDTGKTFDAVRWTGDKEALPGWAQAFETRQFPGHGEVLCVGVYFVRVGRWVLRSDERGDIFPVPEDMFANCYSPIGELGA